MRRLSYCAAVALTTLLVACSNDDTATTSSSSGTSGVVDSGPGADAADAADAAPAIPAPPTLGAQIDRFGRPAINTAANNTFNPDLATKGAAKDAYNQASDESTWSMFAAEVEKNLAILDSLDGNCGNQFKADKTKTDATRYGTLAGLLLDDRLWVNTASTTCTAYLGVEANVVVSPNNDCGGRMPNYEVIKITYSIAALGVTTPTVSDGTTPVAAKTGITTFPYFQAPQ